MTNVRRNDILVALELVIHAFKTTECLGDIAGDGWLLRNDQSFTHAIGRLLLRPIRAKRQLELHLHVFGLTLKTSIAGLQMDTM